jgi:uncharacterized OB-fold protein
MTYARPANPGASNHPDVTDPVSAPFWAAAKRRELVAQKCNDCGDLRYPATEICPRCWSDRQTWTSIRPDGELHSFVVYHRALDPAMRNEVPYTVGRVITDDGVIFTVRLDMEPGQPRVGMRVTASWHDVTDDLTLLRFEAA